MIFVSDDGHGFSTRPEESHRLRPSEVLQWIVARQANDIFLDPVGRAMALKPGQFIYISFDTDAVTEEPHPFILSSAPEQSRLRLSIKRLGDWTRRRWRTFFQKQ
jgi:predicted ferric reductase